MAELTKMFTVATDDSGDKDGPCNLIFSNQDSAAPITTETMHQIVKAELFQKIMGTGGVLMHIGNDDSTLLATNDLDTYAVSRMDIAGPNENILVFDPHRGIRTINLRDIYYTCTLPQKTIVGCSDCMSQVTSRSCVVKNLSEQFSGEEGNWTPYDVTQELKSRKNIIGGFTYVSPRLTATEHFAKTYRSVDEHDFDEVEDRSDTIRQGLQERGRMQNFKQKVCSECLVVDVCHRVRNTRDIRWCRGPFAYTETEAVKAILQKHQIPFKPRELLYLALNSGELSKRYKRRRYWATFRMDYRDTLSFGLCRYATGHYEPFRSFKEAKAILEEYSDNIQVGTHKLLTPLAKAILLELSNHTSSPVNRSRWHMTCYNALGLNYSSYYQEWNLQFKFNSNGGKGSYRPDGLVLPWSITARNFNAIFKETTNLHTLQQDYNHPLVRSNYHR